MAGSEAKFFVLTPDDIFAVCKSVVLLSMHHTEVSLSKLHGRNNRNIKSHCVVSGVS